MKHNNNSLKEQSDLIPLKELCGELSISDATGRNWLRLGKLTPEYMQKSTPYFSREYIDRLKKELHSGSNTALKSRRNKKFISGSFLYSSYVSEGNHNLPMLEKMLKLISDSDIQLDSSKIALLVADCALHLLADKGKMNFVKRRELLKQFLYHELSVGEYDELINELIDEGTADISEALEFCDKYPQLFSLEYVYEKKEDTLGLLYISCKNIGNRKATGSYYTPTKVVQRLIDELDFGTFEYSAETVLDPACGTGNFLLQLPDNVPFSSVYGNDLDTMSAKITRINMALKYGAPVTDICEHITELNYLTDYCGNNTSKFSYIIGNPPWGYDFSEKEKNELREHFLSAAGKSVESYDVFIEQALRQLTANGHLAFVLPEAILNVRAHTAIREQLLQACSIKHLDYLGNAFDKVQCPCIIMDLQYTRSPLSTIGMVVTDDNRSFTINTERKITPEYFSFTTTDEEYNVLNKIRSRENTAYLLGNADFALGIVTGNNKEYISTEKTPENEVILKGSDICRYHIKPTTNYIVFKPESFQQVAPTEMYRAEEKLLYRFISSQLVFAYDNRQTLSLNSCNIVIPRLPGVSIKYVLAILNSGIAQFIYKKEFNSVKVLRSHIENIPIPMTDAATQNKIIEITDKLIAGLSSSEADEAYEKLDEIIMRLFYLNDDDIRIIKKSVDCDNKFLN